jgi:hypothetical protein
MMRKSGPNARAAACWGCLSPPHICTLATASAPRSTSVCDCLLPSNHGVHFAAYPPCGCHQRTEIFAAGSWELKPGGRASGSCTRQQGNGKSTSPALPVFSIVRRAKEAGSSSESSAGRSGRTSGAAASAPDRITGPHAATAAAGAASATAGAATGFGAPVGGARSAAGHSDRGSATTYRPDGPPSSSGLPMNLAHQAQLATSPAGRSW